MKIELEGNEALKHINAVRTLRSLGYKVVKCEWVSPADTALSVGEETVLAAEQPEPQDSKVNDSLLETIGRLHGRNKGLQKGHATLTRRVQELEAQLATTKKQVLPASKPPFNVTGRQAYLNEAFITGAVAVASAPTPTDMALQADIEYLRERVSALEAAQCTNSIAMSPENFNRAVDQALRIAARPGGFLFEGLR